jgi:hypothetical protein
LPLEELVDEFAGRGQSGVNDTPQDAAVLTRPLDQPLSLQHGKVLRYVGSADLQQLR